MEACVKGAFEKLAADKAELWRKRIEDQRCSGQSIRSWCRASGTAEHSFYWWRGRLGLSPAGKRPGKSVEQKPSSMAFARVLVGPSDQPPVAGIVEPIRFRLVGGRELILPASMPIDQVARLVHAIESVA